MRIFSAAAILLLWGALPAYAIDLPPAVTDTVPGHPGVTYEMLLKQAMPGLKKNADGGWNSGPIRRFRDFSDKPAQSEDKPPQDLEISFKSIAVATVHENGAKRLLVLTDDNSGGTGFDAVLAAYDDSTRTPKLLDLVDAGRDQENFVDTSVALAPGTDAFIAYSAHTNSSQGYEMVTPLVLRGGKFLEIASLFIYNIGTCSYDRHEDIAFTTRDDKGSPYRALVGTVTTEIKPGDADCGDDQKPPKHSKTVVTDTWRWDAKKNDFVAATGSLDKLSEKNWKDAEQ